jgi:hypothetical protein
MMKLAALGFRMHSGWGSLVAVSDGRLPGLVARRHIVVAEGSIPGTKQPYHYAENHELKDAEEYLARCAAASRQLASKATREMLSQLAANDYRVKGAAILMASGRALPSLEKILASHALIHTAEGEFFRGIVREACQEAGVAAIPLSERELEERARRTFGKKANQIMQRISGLGRRVGPPWRQDEKLAALAATLILASPPAVAGRIPCE